MTYDTAGRLASFENPAGEITRVSWPTREELRDSTIVVIATVLLVALFVGVVDRVLNLGVGLLFR